MQKLDPGEVSTQWDNVPSFVTTSIRENMVHGMHLAAQNSSAFRHTTEILYLWVLHFEEAHANQTRK